jgi:CheY-like chemotaxis protein
MPLRILHVEDEPDICEVVGYALSRDPEIVLQSCQSGEEALAIVQAWSPDAILLDVKMPVMNGPDTLACLREIPSASTIPVIFLTALIQGRDLEFYSSLGLAGVIHKPFDSMALVESVRSLVG